MLSKEAGGLLTWFASFFFLGLILANPLLLYASLIPFLLYLVGTAIALPRVTVRRTGLANSAFVGETKEVKVVGTITGGVGLVVVYDELPEHFELVEGSNYNVIWKGKASKPIDFSYKLRCTRRGRYRLKGIQWETRHAFGLRTVKAGFSGGSSELLVRPKIPNLRRVRVQPRTTRMLNPMESVAKFGSPSTNFKDIRDYEAGDPFKIINWKATAKAFAKMKVKPLVNEYEREGKRAVWIFLDAAPTMGIGTSVENAFEHGIEAATSIAYAFLNKGFKLGMYVYSDHGKLFYPETGKKQFFRIFKEMTGFNRLGTGLSVFWKEGFSEAIERNKKYLLTLSPVVVVITHVASSNIDDLFQGLKKIATYQRTRRKAQVMVVNVLPYNFIPLENRLEKTTAQILETGSKGLAHRLRSTSAIVLDWNPVDEDFGTKLVTYVRLR